MGFANRGTPRKATGAGRLEGNLGLLWGSCGGCSESLPFAMGLTFFQRCLCLVLGLLTGTNCLGVQFRADGILGGEL